VSFGATLRVPSAKPQAAQVLTRKGLLQRKGGSELREGLNDDMCDECRAGGMQRQLSIGLANDPLETEADRVADQILTGPRRPSVSGISPRIQRLAAPPAGQMKEAPANVHEALASPGRQLEPALRHDMERRFGHDFARVRVHSDATAQQSAREVGANAYTVGADLVFGSGRFSPGTPAGRRLLAHELTHVVQQGEASSVVQCDLYYASGYPNPFAGNPVGETAAAQKTPREWFPSSVDFKETATLSGGGKGISTLAGLLTEIGGKTVGSITDVDLIGHANADLFALGGQITRNSVSGSNDGTIGAAQLAKVQPQIDKVRDRFASGAHITIYGCNSGASGTLLQAISTAFKLCARGFKDPITWCLGWQTNPIRINSRGRTLINPKDATPCDQYNASVYSLKTDVEDCSGTKPKAPDIVLPPHKPSVPEVPE
jgi:hypothetical protein